jgi:TldD protein
LEYYHLKNKIMSNLKITGVIPLLIISLFYAGPLKAQDSLLKILSEEIEREMTELSKQKIPPYYIDYRVDEITSVSLAASFGSLVADNKNTARVLTTNLKVGDYSFDNTHEFKGDYSLSDQSEVFSSPLPIEDKPDAIKQTLWRATDQAYKNAVSAYTALQNRKDKDRDINEPADFSKEMAVTYFEKPLDAEDIAFDKENWVRRLKEYSNITGSDSAVFHCEASFKFLTQRQYFISTEGSTIVENNAYCQIQFFIGIQHEKGTILPLQKSYTAFYPDDLPSNEAILGNLKQMYDDLRKMRAAKLAEPYAGPAILSPEATGVFFHEIFGHRIEGQRLESSNDGQTFKEKIGSKVLPDDFSVFSDPSVFIWDGHDLIGAYHYDEQGIKGQHVVVVEKGILKNFLMSRRPTSEFSNSNGHGRAQPGYAPASRQSNLFVESSKALPLEELREQLIKECKKQKKEYGYFFKEVIGGLTLTDRYNTNIFNVSPTEVYRIYVDGRPDELVTGVELIGTPLTMFSNILSAGDTKEVFTGFCGAESGQIPVTTIAPAIFVKKIETQKTPEYKSKIPILPTPVQVTQ